MDVGIVTWCCKFRLCGYFFPGMGWFSVYKYCCPGYMLLNDYVQPWVHIGDTLLWGAPTKCYITNTLNGQQLTVKNFLSTGTQTLWARNGNIHKGKPTVIIAGKYNRSQTQVHNPPSEHLVLINCTINGVFMFFIAEWANVRQWTKVPTSAIIHSCLPANVPSGSSLWRIFITCLYR